MKEDLDMPEGKEPSAATYTIQFYEHFKIFFFFFIFSGGLMAYGGSQAKGQIGAIAAILRQSHSNAGSQPRL